MSILGYVLRRAEFRLAARRLRRARGFSGATIVVLALGVGATTAAFSIVNGVLLRPLPYPRPDRLVSLGHAVDVPGVKHAYQSDASILLYQEHASAFAGIAAERPTDVNLAATSANDRVERVPAAATSANLFDVLGIPPMLGRVFRPGEDRVAAAPVAVLSYAAWQRRFEGARSIVGRRVMVDGVSREIVGVMPRGFAFPSANTELWIPIAFDPAHAQAASFNYIGVGRLRDAVSIDGAQADLARVLPHILEEFPSGIPPAMWKQAHVEPTVVGLRDSLVGDVARMLWILLASMAMVLLIACANVANLFLVRGEGRQLELAVRGALGSGLAGILAQSLSEAVLLAAVGGGVGMLLAGLGVKLAVVAGGTLGLPRLDEVRVDGSVLLFALIASLACAVFVSMVPVLRARRVPMAAVLRGGRGSGKALHGSPQRARSILVIAQVALALVLVAASALLARSYMRLRDVQPGFVADGVVSARMVLPAASYPTPTARLQLYDAVLARVRATPGVESAALSDWIPLSGDHSDMIVAVEDHPLPPNAVPDDHLVATVDGQYFRTMGLPMLRGRSFRMQDPKRPSLDVVVSHAFARRYWKDESPIGKRIRQGIRGSWYTIVGEVGDAHYDALEKPVNEIVYLPPVTPDSDSTYVPPYLKVLARGSVPTGTIVASIRDAVHAIDPSLPTYEERPLRDLVSAASARAREMLLVVAVASALALVLGAVGIYGVMAYVVSQRQHEIGIRMALGARPSQVRRMVSRAGVALAGIGVAIGAVVAIGVTRFLRSLLYDVSPTSPGILLGTCAALLLVAAAASWIPARRAAALPPAEALRGA